MEADLRNDDQLGLLKNSVVMTHFSRYIKERKLGQGHFGSAWLVKSSLSQRQYVLKEIPLTNKTERPFQEDLAKVMAEVNILKSICHVNIINYKEFDVVGTSVCIIMEYADAGDMHAAIVRQRTVVKKHFPEQNVRNWLVQLALALQYLHREKILHRDVKSQNVFMTKSNILKLGDFGVSKALGKNEEFTKTLVGTPVSVSPEIIMRKPHNHKTDIWSLGVVLYELCALKLPFVGKDYNELFCSVAAGRYAPIPNIYTCAMSDLVRIMLKVDPASRPSACQIANSEVLRNDLTDYMESVRRLMPGALGEQREEQVFVRKGSNSGSVSSAEGSSNASDLSGDGGAIPRVPKR